MDKSLWQTLSSFEVENSQSSYEWSPAMLSCGQPSSALPIELISRLWFCWRPRGLKINLGENLVYLWKSNICSYKLDVHEANVSVSRFHRIGSSFFGCSWSMGCVIELLHSSTNTHQAERNHCLKEKVDDHVPRSRARSEIQSTNTNTNSKRNSNREVDESCDVDHFVTSAKFSQFEAQLHIFEDNEAVIRMIMRVQRWDTWPQPTKSRWIGCLIGFIKTTKSNMLTPKTDSRTC